VDAAIAEITARALAARKGGKVVFKRLDLSSLEAVYSFAAEFTWEYKKLNILVCNAGVLNLPGRSKNGFDLVMAINYVGHWALTAALRPALETALSTRDAPPIARVVNVSSASYALSDPLGENFAAIAKSEASLQHSYGRSKLAVVLATKEWQRRLGSSGITAYAVHPGSMATGLYDSLLPKVFMPLLNLFAAYLLRSAETGALVPLHCALSASAVSGAGKYWANCVPVPVTANGNNAEDARLVFDATEKLVVEATGLDPTRAATTVHVSNLARGTTSDNLRSLFGYCGVIKECVLTPRDDSVLAAVSFEGTLETSTAMRMNGAELSGRKIVVSAAPTKP